MTLPQLFAIWRGLVETEDKVSIYNQPRKRRDGGCILITIDVHGGDQTADKATAVFTGGIDVAEAYAADIG